MGLLLLSCSLEQQTTFVHERWTDGRVEDPDKEERRRALSSSFAFGGVSEGRVSE